MVPPVATTPINILTASGKTMDRTARTVVLDWKGWIGFMFTSDFWKQTVERFIKTFVQTFLAAGITYTATAGDWKNAGLAALIAAGFSILTSLASLPFGDKGTPSLVVTPTTPAVPVKVEDSPTSWSDVTEAEEGK